MSSLHHDRKLFGLLLVPSWLSGIIAVTTGLAVSVGTIILARYKGSTARLEFLQYRAGHTIGNYHTISSGLQANKLIANLPLLIFWGLVGMVVYLFASNIIGGIKNASELKHELGYAHVRRKQLIWDAAKRLLVRLAVIALWIPYILFFFHHLVPYCIAGALLGSAQLPMLQGFAHTLLAVFIMAVAVHVHIVLLRLLFLRPRLFSQALYVD